MQWLLLLQRMNACEYQRNPFDRRGYRTGVGLGRPIVRCNIPVPTPQPISIDPYSLAAQQQ